MTIEEIESGLPWGFHDAHLVRMELDWTRQELALTLCVQIGEHQETDRLARVVVTGLHFFIASPPRGDPSDREQRDELPWIDSGAGRVGGDTETRLPPIPEGYFLHHVYTRGVWQCFYFCGRDATLSWVEPAPVPSRSGRKVYFSGE